MRRRNPSTLTPAPRTLAPPTAPRPAAYLQLHLAVALAGLTAVLGEVLTLSALPLVWWRVGLASASFVPLVWWARRRGRAAWPPRREALAVAAIGALVGLHWVTFYGSIKLANASVALVCFATVSLMTALLEPRLLGKRVDWTEVGLGALVIPGMACVVGAVRADYHAGLAVGLLSALLAAVFSTLNKRYVGRVGAATLSGLEMAGAFAFLSAAYPLLRPFDMGAYRFWPQAADWPYLLTLVFACTTLAFWLMLRALREVSAFAANLTLGLEPVYGIALAALLLRQDRALSGGFYVGAALILAAVVAHPVLGRWRRRRAGGLTR